MKSGKVHFETRLGAQAESELSVGVDLSLVASIEEYFSENEGIQSMMILRWKWKLWDEMNGHWNCMLRDISPEICKPDTEK